MKERYLFESIHQDILTKMVFLGGPRQVGKTTFAKNMAETISPNHFEYLNWDASEDKKNIIQKRFDSEASLLLFDEIHKYKDWKNYLKGLYDTAHEKYNILVTGSARLDVYRKGGDSMMGRYFSYRLHPFSVAEMFDKTTKNLTPFEELVFLEATKTTQEYYRSLFTLGGFPEPLFAGDERALRRFQIQRVDRLIREDIRDLENIRDISLLQVMTSLLPERVGSLFSLNSLREDIQVAHKTISSWADILERMYYLYRISPYSGTLLAMLRKEPKMYLWDWSEVPIEGGKRLENIVASHLLKFVHFLEDSEGYRAELFFLRDRDGREVDFLITVNQKPWFAVEVKQGNSSPSKHLLYFQERFSIPYLYQVGEFEEDVIQKGVRIMPVWKFLSGLV